MGSNKTQKNNESKDLKFIQQEKQAILRNLISTSLISLSIMISYLSCSKEAQIPQNSPDPDSIPIARTDTNTYGICDYRPIIHVSLIPVRPLSVGRGDMVVGAAGKKIVFAFGHEQSGPGYLTSGMVDIFDIESNTLTSKNLFYGERDEIAVASVGNKILFAGGAWLFDGVSFSRVDIYDAIQDSWTSAELSEARMGIATAVSGTKAYFSGGFNMESPAYSNSDKVDIYDEQTNSWSTSSMSTGKSSPAAVAIDNKIFIAGGTTGFFENESVTKSIDVFDEITHQWNTSVLQTPRTRMAAIVSGNKIFWAGGFYSTYNTGGWIAANTIEIMDLSTGINSSVCMIPRADFKAVLKDDNIIFFTGNGDDSRSRSRFEIYNTTTQKWFTGVLDLPIIGAAIISVNNTVYVAGGSENGNPPFYNQIWKLEF